MTLRQRLVLTLVATAVPLVAAAFWIRGEFVRRSAEQALREVLLSRLDAIGRERCEADPEAFGEHLPGRRGELRGTRSFPPAPFAGPDPPRHFRRGPWAHRFGRPIEIYAYDGSLRAVSSAAPSFPAELEKELDAETETAARSSASDAGVRGVEVAVRTGWSDGPCAVVLARRVDPAPPGLPPGLIASTAALLAALLAAVWVAAGPTVRRVRRLTSEVRRSAAARYESRVGVTGGDEISDLARAFNEAAAELRSHLASIEKREQTLRAFLANTTHDVMLPLTVLQGHLSTMRNRVAQGEPVGKDLVLSAIEEAHYMASLVHNLGAVAKLDAGEPLIQRHRVDLNALVERVVERHRPVARPRGIEVNFAVPETSVEVEADVTLIEQAVGNVVANAVRYNRSGGHVAVILELRPAGGSGFCLRVVDDGPGVSEEQLLRLSERNYRGDDARTRHPDGLGLGLHIARDVALRHGFTLSFARSEYGGLEVTFAGPLAPGSPGDSSRN